jgi:hypothetical protein
MTCNEHPTYNAVRPPKHDCPTCQAKARVDGPAMRSDFYVFDDSLDDKTSLI